MIGNNTRYIVVYSLQLITVVSKKKGGNQTLTILCSLAIAFVPQDVSHLVIIGHFLVETITIIYQAFSLAINSIFQS